MKTVRRDPALKDNASLPAAFKQLAGRKIYTGLVDGFEGEEFGAPPPCEAGASFDCVSLTSILRVWLEVFEVLVRERVYESVFLKEIYCTS